MIKQAKAELCQAYISLSFVLASYPEKLIALLGLNCFGGG